MPRAASAKRKANTLSGWEGEGKEPLRFSGRVLGRRPSALFALEGCPRGRAARLPSLWKHRALLPLAECLHPAAESGVFFFRLCGPLGQHTGKLPQHGRPPRHFDKLLERLMAQVDRPHPHRVADAGQRQTLNPHGAGFAQRLAHDGVENLLP
jgi:hypothetical protein